MTADIDTNIVALHPRAVPVKPSLYAQLLGSLAATLEEVIGEENASGLTARVGNEIGEQLAREYCAKVGHIPGTMAEIAQVIVNFERDLGGHLTIAEMSDTHVVFTAKTCPFSCATNRKPSLCAMVVNMIGRIAADAAGYACVRVERALALGHSDCRVILSLVDDQEDDAYEFFA
jgi:predicted ArsR family transcriptional regulator